MASSKLMTSSSSLANSDTARNSSSLSALMADLPNTRSQNATVNATITMDELLKNIYSENSSNQDLSVFPKSADDVWKDIGAGAGGSRSRYEQPPGDSKGENYPGITLEDFLSRTPIGQEDAGGLDGNFVHPHQVPPSQSHGQVIEVAGVRGKRRAVVEDPPVDKATQKKQRRMIKNRESAARSRERKQAYTSELEALVTQLEEEKTQLLREQAEHNKERFNKLVENLIPVGEGQRPQRVLRKVQSNLW